MPRAEGTRNPSLLAQMKTQEVIEKLKQRGVSNDHCVRCNAFDWSVDFLELTARPAVFKPGSYPPVGAGLYTELQFAQPVPTGFIRVVCLVCKNCGYTMFHDLGVLETT